VGSLHLLTRAVENIGDNLGQQQHQEGEAASSPDVLR
jgi:hypothetical protein